MQMVTWSSVCSHWVALKGASSRCARIPTLHHNRYSQVLLCPMPPPAIYAIAATDAVATDGCSRRVFWS
jgi:hypothetical protein